MCSLCRLPVVRKAQFWANWISGAPVPTPFYRWKPHLVCYSRPRYTLTCQISSRSVYSVAKNHNFCPCFRRCRTLIGARASRLQKQQTTQCSGLSPVMTICLVFYTEARQSLQCGQETPRHEKLDGRIVWNAQNTIIGSKCLAVSATV